MTTELGTRAGRATRRPSSAWLALLCALVGATICLAGTPTQADDAEARALVKRLLDAAPAVPFTAKMTLAIEGGGTRELALNHKRLDKVRASYLEVTAPLNLKDTRFLFFERTEGPDEQFIFIPSMKRTSQVSEETRTQPFLGSEFYVSDLVTPELDAFNYAFVGEETIDGRAAKRVEATPKTTANPLYSKVVFAIEPSEPLLLKTEFYDPKGKLLKVWTLEKLEKIDGVWTPLQHRMTNVQEKTSSRITISEVKYNAEVPDQSFTRAYLSR